jgi:thiamine biosynthesis lipoprotein ApbE
MSAMHQVSEKKLTALEANLGRMKNEQETLKRKLKVAADEKAKIQHELQRYQQQVKSLEQKTEQQQLVIKQKTHKVASASRRLRKQTQNQFDITNKQDRTE